MFCLMQMGSSSTSTIQQQQQYMISENRSTNGRKRRPSDARDEDPVMDDCMAAMVLMSLSCSPKSSLIPAKGIYSISCTSIDSGVAIGSVPSRNTTPSPPTLNGDITYRKIDSRSPNKDEGIEMDETIDSMVDDASNETAKKNENRIVFQCTWPKCGHRCDACEDIERHVRIVHLGRCDPPKDEENDDHEEEFYYSEIEIADSEFSESSDSTNLSSTLSSSSSVFFGPTSAPTWSHLDMVRPPHENPEYKLKQNVEQTLIQQINAMSAERKSVISSPINIPGISLAHHKVARDVDNSINSMNSSVTRGHSMVSGHLSQASLLASSSSPVDFSSPKTSSKMMRLSYSSSASGGGGSKMSTAQWTSLLHQPGSKPSISPSRRSRTETRKCRKVYGMENRDSWCTQCKWKKACTRFVD